MERRFRLNTPAVAAEVIDGEAVIMNLKSGAYFSTRDVGCILWSWIEQGIPQRAMVEALGAAFQGSSEVITDEVGKFVATLVEKDLIRELAPEMLARIGAAPAATLAGDTIPAGTPFVTPVLETYTDMEDLLLLDPIHEVDDDAGWPRPKAT